jgi:hypothetical protein
MKSVILILALMAPYVGALAGEWSTSGSVGAELRWFFDDAQFPGQLEGGQASLILAPEWDWDGAEGRHQVSLAPFFRLDGRDDERTHFDLREGYWRGVWDDVELLAGVGRVFWGVTESRHLVDVINQTDFVEDIDNEDKLGQPMVQAAFQRGFGRVELFLLPGFRERTFPGVQGRLRLPLPIDTDHPIFESGAGRERIDGALRYSHYFGDWDVGAHLFHGTGREPSFVLDPAGTRLLPFYQVTTQVGVDVQYTREAWLWKFEGLVREGQGDTFGALVGGFEYTFYQVGKSAADVGLLVEYLYDGRDETAPPTLFDDDLFVGSRLAVNDTQDTQLLVGVAVDRNDGSLFGLIEAERRIGQNYKIELESRLFANVDPGNLLTTFKQDSLVTLRVSRYF